MLTMLRLTKKGLGTLPHYGAHPGVPIVIVLLVITALAGAQRGGLIGFAGGLLFAAFVYLPFLFWGAHSRSVGAMHLMRKERVTTVLQAFADVHCTNRPVRFGIRLDKHTFYAWCDNPPYLEIPPSVQLLLEDALTIDGILAVPTSCTSLTLYPNRGLSAHEALHARHLLSRTTYPDDAQATS